MKKKYCFKCGKTKFYNDFSKNKNRKEGFGTYCLKCDTIRKNEYHKTKQGILTMIYADQRKASLLRKHNMPKYTKNEFCKWVFNCKNFDDLFNIWVMSEYQKNLKPSIDRLDNSKGYSLNNIRLVTWGENCNRQYEDKKNGIDLHDSRTVVQYDQDNNYVAEYYSISKAHRDTGISAADICSNCKGRLFHAGGFIWKYKNK